MKQKIIIMTKYIISIKLEDRILSGFKFTRGEDVEGFLRMCYRMSNYLAYKVEVHEGGFVSTTQSEHFC
jgi:hypothetical protein